MKRHYIKVTALSPLHIGSGEDYEPTNFIIEDGKLYEFDETAFYHHLTPAEKGQFNAVVSQNRDDMLFSVHAFVKKHSTTAKKVAKNSVDVSQGIARDYESKIGRAVQLEGRGRSNTQRVFNQFQIMRTQHLRNLNMPYIPGSSLKGAVSTGFQEALFKNKHEKWTKWFDELRNPTLSPMKNLLFSDLQPVEGSSRIGYAVNKERFEDDTEGPSTKLETIQKGSTFVGMVSFKEMEPKLPYTLEDLAQECNAHYKPIFDSMFSSQEKIVKYLDKTFTNKDLSLGKTRFLVRIGRHSGARAVTIDGHRSIRVKVSGGGKNRKPNVWENLDEETTTWLFAEEESQLHGLIPFGWVVCEIIDEQIYRDLAAIQLDRLEAKEQLLAQQKAEKRAEEEALRVESERKVKEQEEAEEAERIAKEEAAARLASLSPVDRLIEETEITELINMMRSGEIEEYESIKLELAQKIKSKLQAEPKNWDKAKKKAEIRKKFIQDILGES